MKNLFLIVFIFFLVFPLGAQESSDIQYMDIIYLKNGSKLKGNIVSYDVNGETVFNLLGGGQLIMPSSDIKKIRQVEVNDRFEKVRLSKPYLFEEKGIYTTIGAYTLGATQGIGLGAQASVGYQINRLFGLGLSFARDSYDPSNVEILYPIGLEVRGYMTEKNISPFYAFNTGYGLAFEGERNNLIEAKGGWMFNPRIGLRLGARSDVNLLASIGYRFQPASFERGAGWWGINRTENHYYRRFEVKFALILN